MSNYYDYDYDDPKEDISGLFNELERTNKTYMLLTPDKNNSQRKLSTGEDNDAQIFEENDDVVTENELIANTPSNMPENEDIKDDCLHDEQSPEIKHENKTTGKAGTTQKARKRQKPNNDLRNKLMQEIEASFDAPHNPDTTSRYDDIINLKKSFGAFRDDIEFLGFMKKLAHKKILDRELFMLFCHVYYNPYPENYYTYFRSLLFSSNSQNGKYNFIKESIRMINKNVNKYK